MVTMGGQRLAKGLLIVGFTLLLAACGGSSTGSMTQDEMQDEIKQAFLNWQNADSGTFDLDVEGTVESDAVSSGEVEREAENFFFDGTFAGKSMLVDKENEKFDFEFNLSGEGSMNDAELQAISASVVMKEDNLYFKVNEFPNLDSPELASVNTIVALFKGKWWSVPVPADVYNQSKITSWLSLPADSDELTEEQKQLHELYKAADFFESIDKKGTETIGGVKSDAYEVTLDAEGLFDYAVTYGEISGEPMSVEEQEDLKTTLESSEVELTVFVAAKEKYLSGIKSTLKSESPDPESPGRMDLMFDFVFENFNASVEIEAPEDSTPFDLGAMFGAPTGGFELTE